MGKRDTALGQRYWHGTFDEPAQMMARGLGEEGGPDEPPKFKIYRGRPRHPLPQHVPDRLTPAPPGPLPADTLGQLLYYGYGFSRVDLGPLRGWPNHRIVPSARCFYPTELYLWLPAGGPYPAGVYHYDQLHHALVELRRGDFGPLLGAAAGADLAGAVAVVLLTSHFWKTAFRYRHYAYRLCSQEVGMVAGNVLFVAGQLGLRAHAHYRYLDEVTDRLLAVVPGEERTMALLPIYPAGGREAPVAAAVGAADALRDTLPPLGPTFLDAPGPKNLSAASELYELDAASVLTTGADFAAARRADPASTSDAPRVPLPAPAPLDAVAALRRRNSGGTVFKPVGGPISAAQLAAVLSGALARYPCDLGDAPLTSCHLVIQSVDGVPGGIYRLAGDGSALVPVAPLPPGRLDAQLRLGPPALDFPNANVLAYVVGDRDLATNWLGNRGYRILSADAGVVAQRLCVGAGSVGLAARPANGYSLPAVRELLRLGAPGLVPIFQIAVGRRTVNAQYEMPIIF